MTTLPIDDTEPRSRILIVDDEAEILVALSDLLDEEFDIVSTTRPQDALDLLIADPNFAVIISDQRMPVMTGDALLSQAQRVSRAKGILLTGYADLTAVIAALNQGRIQFYVHKPWDSDALKAMVRESARRFHIEDALRTEQFLLQSSLQAATFDVIFSDAAGRVLRHNRQRRPTTCPQGLTGAEGAHCATGMAEEALYPEDERAAITESRQKAVEDGVVETAREVTRDGNTRWIEQTRVLLPWPRSADGALRPPSGRWHVTFSRDVTEKRIMAQKLRQDDKMRAIGTLSGGIAHDFNNLLTAILGSLDLLEELLPDDLLEAEALPRKLIDNAVSAARKGASLTRGLLEFGRPKDVALTSVNLVELILNLRELLTQSLNRTSDVDGETDRCELDMSGVERHPPDIFVLSDPEQLEMALLNLCINARDAMREGGRVHLDLRRRKASDGQSYGCVSVTDTGHGMTPDVAARIFDPFFSTKKIGEGTGLGLSTIYRFLKRSGGDIQVESQVGKGTQIRLLLPLAPAESVPVQVPDNTDARHTTMRDILLVDDESHVRLVTERFLTRKGHRVSSFADGASAIAHLERGAACDLAVIDLIMPGMSGSACGARLLEIKPSLKILYVSGYSDLVDLPPEARLLEKPYSTSMLDDAIDALWK